MKLRFGWLALLLLSGIIAWAQPKNAPDNWFHLNPSSDGFPGVSSQKMYDQLLNGAKGESVIVAVIDGGVDYLHEDLKNVMWVNPGEIAGNGIDDDKNGYIDDVHGWNFIGGKDGRDVQYDNLEVTRLYRKYKDQFDNVDEKALSKDSKKLYEQFLEYKDEVESKREEMEQNVAIYEGVYKAVKGVKDAIGKENITLADVKNFSSNDPMQTRAALILANLMSEGASFDDVFGELKEAYEYYNGHYAYKYNPDYDSRQIVGDNYADLNERYYGNNDVKGPDAEHGTHVAGIIGAQRGNGIGMDGIASNVRIMALRVVPDGDERDKDVANAIYYAVDNGAKVINMSFGKGYSPNKEVVDKAVKYAMKHDVLLVHAAGNDGKENSAFNNYPNDRYQKAGLFGPRYADNWVEVGAVDWEGGEHLAATFSNYSPENVDLFAPGVDIYSTVPENQYKDMQGTSMAAPVVTGIAAVLRSYFPDLTAGQVKSILMASTDTQTQRVVEPGSDDKVPFTRLCQTGGVADAYKAVQLAAETKGKNKKANRYFGPYQAADKKGKKEVVVP